MVSAAVSCKIGMNAFEKVLTGYGLLSATKTLKDEISFMSEVYWTYTGAKDGWTYDYVNPNASGRKNGYVQTVFKSNAGKITLGWDGPSNARTNFRWMRTAHPACYDISNTTILNTAFDMYTASIMVYGHWNG